MRRRDLSKALVASVTTPLVGTSATAAQSTADNSGMGRYPRSAAEIAQKVVPRDLNYPPGSPLRYGADPTGATDSSAAWRDAIKSNSYVFDDYPGGGSYRFDSEVAISRFPITISGSAKQFPGSQGGTTLTLSRAAGPGKAVLRTTDWAAAVRIERIRLAWQATNSGQCGLRFAELRASKILDCVFIGSQAAGTDVVGIRFDGSGTYTGDITVRGNYFSALLCGIELQGSCTSVRILENEIYGYVSQAKSCGIRISAPATEPCIAFNMLEGWTVGIESTGGYVKQIANSYEANGTNFKWQRGAANQRIWNISIAETFISGGTPVYPLNDTDACMVLSGPGIASFDNMSLNARRGFFSYGRSAKEGDWTAEPFNSAAYGANNSGSWSVSSGDANSVRYTRIGHTMIVNFRIDSSQIGGTRPSQLYIALPQSERAVSAAVSTCFIHDGTGSIGKTWTTAGSDRLTITKSDDAVFNTGAFSCAGSITFECS